MKILRFYIDMFAFLRDYYNDKWEALIIFIGILGFNLLSFFYFIESILNNQLITSHFFSEGGFFEERLYTFFTYYIPLCILFLLIYLLNKKKIKHYLHEYSKSTKDFKQKRKIQSIIYFIVSVLFFFFSVFI